MTADLLGEVSFLSFAGHHINSSNEHTPFSSLYSDHIPFPPGGAEIGTGTIGIYPYFLSPGCIDGPKKVVRRQRRFSILLVRIYSTEKTHLDLFIFFQCFCSTNIRRKGSK